MQLILSGKNFRKQRTFRKSIKIENLTVKIMSELVQNMKSGLIYKEILYITMLQIMGDPLQNNVINIIGENMHYLSLNLKLLINLFLKMNLS